MQNKTNNIIGETVGFSLAAMMVISLTVTMALERRAEWHALALLPALVSLMPITAVVLNVRKLMRNNRQKTKAKIEISELNRLYRL